MLHRNPLYETSSLNQIIDLEPDEMSPRELRQHPMDTHEKIGLVQQQMAALCLPCVMEVIYRDDNGYVINTERSEWNRLYCELLGESHTI